MLLVRRYLPIRFQVAIRTFIRFLRLPYQLVGDLVAIIRYGENSPRKFQLLFVRTGDIYFERPVGVVGAFKVHPSKHWCVVADGDWDVTKYVASNTLRTLRIVRERVITGESWEELGEHSWMREWIRRYGAHDDCRTDREISLRCLKLDKLIKTAGEQRSLLTRREMNTTSFRESGGIEVAIGRGGEIIFADAGTHRLGIARALNIPIIPVCVVLVHPNSTSSREWQRLSKMSDVLAIERDRIHSNI